MPPIPDFANGEVTPSTRSQRYEAISRRLGDSLAAGIEGRGGTAVKATNWAKAVYVSVYLTVVSIIAVYAGWRLFEGGLNIGYIGAVLANAPSFCWSARAWA